MPRHGQIKTPTAAFLWENAHRDYDEMAEMLGATRSTVAKCSSRLEFRRPMRSKVTFAAGPCLECGVQFRKADLDADFACAGCRVTPLAAPAAPPVRTLTDPTLLDIYEHELALRLARKGVALAYSYPGRVRIIVRPDGKRDEGLYGFERRPLDVRVVEDAYRDQTAKLEMREVA